MESSLVIKIPSAPNPPSTARLSPTLATEIKAEVMRAITRVEPKIVRRETKGERRKERGVRRRRKGERRERKDT